MDRKEKKAQQGAYDFLECLWGIKYDPDYVHQFQNKEETGLSTKKIQATLKHKYQPVGIYLVRKPFILTGEDIDAFIRESADKLHFEVDHPIPQAREESIPDSSRAVVDQILPSRYILEKFHFTGQQQRCKPLAHFVTQQLLNLA